MSSVFSAVALSKRYMEMDYTPRFAGYSGVEIVYSEDEEVAPYFAGDRSGRVLTINNPWGTQEQADNILEKIKGYQYQPYNTTSALLDPAAELGDGISTRGFYAGIHKIDRDYSALMATNITAPQDEEVNHEYPFEAKANRDITRRFTQVASELSLQSGQIEARVTKTGGNNDSFGWSLTSGGFSLHSGGVEVFKVDPTGASVRGLIKATSGEIGGFSIKQNAIFNNIPDLDNEGGITQGVYIGNDGIRLGKTFSVDNYGRATATSLTVDTLYIGGNAVSAETLNNHADSAYTSTSSGGYCYGGAGFGYNWDKVSKGSTTCNYLKTKYLVGSGTVILRGYFCYWDTIKDYNGVEHWVLKRGSAG